MRRAVALYVADILKYMQDAERYVQGMTTEQFEKDDKTVNAVLRALEVVGEAAKNIPDELRARYSDIPWREMAGMRDKVIHSYFEVDFETVWIILHEDIPALKPAIEKMLNDLRKNESNL